MKRIAALTLLLGATQFGSLKAGEPVASPTLCKSEEITAFTCTFSNHKTVSLCTTAAAAPAVPLLRYRFGRISAIELEYPGTETPASKAFRMYRYSFPKGESVAVAFDLPPYRYSVFRTNSVYGYNGAGIILSKDKKQVSTSMCQAPKIDGSNTAFYNLADLNIPSTVSDIDYIGPE